MNATIEANASTIKQQQPGEFTGKYSAIQRELWGDLQRYLSLSPEVSHVVCDLWACDFGRAMSRQTIKGVSYGKLDKNGAMSLGESIKKVKELATYPLSLAATCHGLTEVKRYGAIENYGGKIHLTKLIEEWLGEKVGPAAAKQFPEVVKA